MQIGHLRLSVRSVGEDFYLLVSDTQNPAIREFKGTTWFPINPSYRVPAIFTAYAEPEQVRISMTHVESKTSMTSTGDVTFQLNGETVRLKSFLDDNELFVMFQDGTNDKQTYRGGRFLSAPLPKDGATVLDFNKAFNPYCIELSCWREIESVIAKYGTTKIIGSPPKLSVPLRDQNNNIIPE